ncbi:hypothetical protein [Schlesneria sp. DSM 10557]|uniref:hypothetical protein n=1 Tax=Schlesneria sp. DSM 10557 TaxID=3044399 RepID=UPI0035A0C446
MNVVRISYSGSRPLPRGFHNAEYLTSIDELEAARSSRAGQLAKIWPSRGQSHVLK